MVPKISVVITTYNGERFLAETLQSVLDQSLSDFELIIINDGSTDGTEKIIKNFMSKDKRIIYLKNPKNKGYDNLHNVINMGLKVARGKYIARLDSDDICYKGRFKTQYEYLEKNKDIFLIGSSADIIDKDGNKVDEIIKKPWPSFFLRMRIAFSNPLIHSSIMFRNEGFLYPNRNEHLFYFFLMINDKKIKNLRDRLVKYRLNPTGLVSQYSDLRGDKYEKWYRELI